MNRIVEQLHEDHRRLVRALYHLEREIKAYVGLARADSSLEVILDIINYIQSYPELWHHPVEDIIYQRLVEKGVEGAEEAAGSMEEHSMLELLTDNLYRLINQLAAGDGSVVGRYRVRLVKAGSDYLQRQLLHIEKEQQLLLPLIEQHLDASDWETIKCRIKDRSNLFDANSRLQEYEVRYKAIANASAVTAH